MLEDLIDKLGINWKLLLSQIFNFSILLFALWRFAYKPLLAILKKRREKIEEGLAKAEEAGLRLQEIDRMAKETIKKAENESMEILKETEKRGKTMEREMVLKIEKREKEMFDKAKIVAERKKEEAEEKIFSEATGIIKAALAKTVELRPEEIDEALVKKAISEIRKEKYEIPA